MIATNLPRGRDGRILAVLIASLAVAAIWAGLLLPLFNWYTAREQTIAGRMAIAQRMAGIAASLPAVQRAAAAARLQEAPSAILLAGTSDAIAGASLEGLIDSMTRDAQADLISTEALPSVQQGGYRRIALHVAVRAPYANLIQLLSAVEQANPRMSIGDLQIQAGPLAGTAQLLDLTFSAMAFRAGTASQSPSPPAAPDPDGSGQ